MELNVTKCLVKGADWSEEILLSSDLEYLLRLVAVHTFFSFGSFQGASRSLLHPRTMLCSHRELPGMAVSGFSHAADSFTDLALFKRRLPASLYAPGLAPLFVVYSKTCFPKKLK